MGFMFKPMTPEEYEIARQPGGDRILEEKWRKQKYAGVPNFKWNIYDKYKNCLKCKNAMPEGRLDITICRLCKQRVTEKNICSNFSLY